MSPENALRGKPQNKLLSMGTWYVNMVFANLNIQKIVHWSWNAIDAHTQLLG